MELNFVKSLSYFNQKKIFKTTKIKQFNFFGKSFHLNFRISCHNKLNSFDRHRKRSEKKQLIILGLNWNKFNSYDIFSIFKPFEYDKRKISEVSLAYFLLKSDKYLEKKSSTNEFFFSKSKFNLMDSSLGVKVFAQIKCNSNRTTRELYRMCNGLEIGNENSILDIRMVDQIFFSKALIIETATKLPESYFPQFLNHDFLAEKKENSGKRKRHHEDMNIKKIENKQKLLGYKKKKNFNKSSKKKFNFLDFHCISNQKVNHLKKIKNFLFKIKFLLGKPIINQKL